MEMGEWIEMVETLDDAQLIRLMYEVTEEIEARIMARAGEAYVMTEEDEGKLPF